MSYRNRYYPPEWEKQQAVWLSWPHNEKEWGKRLPEIKNFYKKLISIILNFQDVNLLLAHEDLLNNVNFLHFKKHKLKKIIIPNNDIWIRDYGPFFVVENSRDCSLQQKLILNFEFNSWGRKFPPWDLDNKVPKEIAFYLGCEIESYPIVLEGGGVEFSGNGLLLTTKQCLLNKNRNVKLNQKQIENIVKSGLNIEEIIWLERGLDGDHTDGHIDNVARFISPQKVLISKTNDKKDKNYEHLNESIEHLKKWRHPKRGYKLEVLDLPLPSKIKLKNKRLPNSYVNFIFVNGGIIVPTFSSESDKEVLAIFKKLFPRRTIVGLDCSLLIKEGGGLHCISKQEPLGIW